MIFCTKKAFILWHEKSIHIMVCFRSQHVTSSRILTCVLYYTCSKTFSSFQNQYFYFYVWHQIKRAQTNSVGIPAILLSYSRVYNYTLQIAHIDMCLLFCSNFPFFGVGYHLSAVKS